MHVLKACELTPTLDLALTLALELALELTPTLELALELALALKLALTLELTLALALRKKRCLSQNVCTRRAGTDCPLHREKRQEQNSDAQHK